MRLHDGTQRHLKRVEIADGVLRGTTTEGERVRIPAAEIERAWQRRSDPNGLVPVFSFLTVTGLVTIIVLASIGPFEF